MPLDRSLATAVAGACRICPSHQLRLTRDYCPHPTWRTISMLSRLLTVSLVFLLASSLLADVPRALPEGKLPNDVRLQPPKDLNGYFPFTPSQSPQEWNVRAEKLRRQLQASQGLWPLPTKTPLNAVVHGKVERDDFTCERVYFESMPGFYVTGNLYRPKGKSGKLPG